MVLEATMIVLDTSEYMRNGDYLPTRFEAQVEAATTIFTRKVRDNPESTVGLMTLEGTVKTTFVHDIGAFLVGIRDTTISGPARFSSALQVAALALKHRQNKNQRQRILIFCASPIEDDERDLVKLAKRMKKNNIAVDVVIYGQELHDNSMDKLQAFADNVNSGDNSHLLEVSPGQGLLSDVVMRSPIMSGDGGAQHDDFGDMFMDPNEDPELALALRMSLEEERQRQERQRQERERA